MDALDLIIEAQERGLAGEDAPDPPKVPGHCRYCGKAIAQGVWLHEKHCKAKVKR